MKPRAAILFRGHCFRAARTLREWGVDWRAGFASQKLHLIDALREKFEVDVFISSYRVDDVSPVLRDYRPLLANWHAGDSTQRERVCAGIDDILTVQKLRGTYQAVVLTRFDLELKMRPWHYGDFKPGCINFLWREWNQASWDDHHRVPDAIHMMPGELLEDFRKGVMETPTPYCLHLVWYPVSRHVGPDRINIMNPEGYHDSNTSIEPNDVYTMVRVP